MAVGDAGGFGFQLPVDVLEDEEVEVAVVVVVEEAAPNLFV